MYSKRKENYKKKKGKDCLQPSKTHIHIKKMKQRERMVSKIAFFLEKQNMKQRGTMHYVNEKEKECL